LFAGIPNRQFRAGQRPASRHSRTRQDAGKPETHGSQGEGGETRHHAVPDLAGAASFGGRRFQFRLRGTSGGKPLIDLTRIGEDSR
jgi:hypothetical protein